MTKPFDSSLEEREKNRARAWAWRLLLMEVTIPEAQHASEEERKSFIPRTTAAKVVQGEMMLEVIVSSLLCGVTRTWIVFIKGEQSWFARPSTRK